MRDLHYTGIALHVALALALTRQVALGFVVPIPMSQIAATATQRKHSSSFYQISKTCLHLQSDGEFWAQNQRHDLERIVEKIDSLQEDIQGWNATGSNEDDIRAKQLAVEQLEKEAEMQLSTVIPPEGLSMDEFKAAIKVFFQVGPQYRLAFVRALGMDEADAKDPYNVPLIIRRLYEEQYSLTPKLLKDSLKASREAQPLVTMDSGKSSSNTNEGFWDSFLEGFSDGRQEEEKELEMSTSGYLPRVTRKEGVRPSEADLEILVQALDNKLFSASARPTPIPGGYVIRGENRLAAGKDLISSLDAKLPESWDCTVSYMYDVSSIADDNFFEEDNALILLKKDFSPVSSEWYYRVISLLASGTILLFSIGVYGANEDVLNRLTDASSLGDFSGLDWFNGKVGQIVGPLLLILASHEFGHCVVAKNEKIETTSWIPTFLPIFGSLPLLGTLTRIKSSPKNLTALFDFAFLGPLFGFASSLIFFGSGLVATKADLNGDTAAQYLPSLPVSVINLSTFGGSIIDNFFAGGDGYITALDPTSPVALHPFAIVGYCGLLINAADMLPLGATDGGRLSLSIFGRRGHSIIGGLTWFALLVASFTLDDTQTPLLITAWATNNILQNDMEIPCRDETENVSLPRIVAAFSLWFLAVLTLVPINAQ